MEVNSLEIRSHFAKDLTAYATREYPEACRDWKSINHDIANSITIPKEDHGDFSSSICFVLAKRAKESPAGIAGKLASAINAELEPGGVVKKLENENGYLNLWLDEARYGKAILEAVMKKGKNYGSSGAGKGKRVIVEFPSVNPNKPWHIGHLRNALLGDSVSNTLVCNSYEVEREDYIDDLGLQMAEMLWGRKHLAEKSGKKYDQLLGEQYVVINREIQEKHAEEEVNKILRKMEEMGSKEQREEREMAEKVVRAQYETAFSYGIYHDVLIWESDIVRNQLLKNAMDLLAERGITKVPGEGKYAGCVVVETKSKYVKEEENVKVFIRNNGVATYIAKDLAFHMWKLGMLSADFRYTRFAMQPDGKTVYTSSKEGESIDFGNSDLAVNIIGSAQQYPQNVLKEVFEAVNGKGSRIVHVAYGEVSMKEGTLSGRKGGWIGEERNYTADDLLREMNKKTLGVVRKSEKIKEKRNEKEIARRIALSAIKFEFLRVDPEKKIVFDWESALDLNANSGPYCMYMYARASRILEKAGPGSKKPRLKAEDCGGIGRSYDFELIKLIGRAQEITEKACREYRPSVIAEYLMELSQIFGKFYEHMPVLKSEDSKTVRIAMVMAARQVIYNMLSLLGIQTVESM